MEMNFSTGAQGFWNAAQAEPERLALVDPTEREWSRGDLFKLANQLVRGLRAQGMVPGDVVAVLLPNSVEYIALNLAATQAGFYLVPINWHLASAEVAYILKDSGAKTFVCHASTWEVASKAIEQVGFDTNAVFSVGPSDRTQSIEDLIQDQPAELPEDRALGAVMFYTSGTTGKPKGVKRALMPIDPDTSAVMYTMLLSLFGIQPEGDNVHFCGSPLYHTAVMNWSVASLHMGHVLVMHDHWDAENMLAAVEKYKVTTTHVVPTQMVRLHKLPDMVKENFDLSSMTHMVHTAAPISKSVKADMLEWWGPCIYEYYASTEGGGAIARPGRMARASGHSGQGLARCRDQNF